MQSVATATATATGSQKSSVPKKKELHISVPEKVLPILTSRHRYNVLYGGRGSAKSWTVALGLILKAYQRKTLNLCVREIQKTIKDSVHSLLAVTIERLALDKFFTITKDEIRGANGSKFIFKGLKHNITEIKSLEGVDYCWVEEAHNVSQDSWDILYPTIRKEGSKFYIVYNPEEENAPVHQEYVVGIKYDSLIIKVNYYDNPYFPEVLRRQMEWDKEHNYEKYLYIWEGNCKKISDACVFKGYYTIQDFETPSGVDFYYGADWGFSTDPATLVRCFILDDCLYIDYEAYGVGVDIDELPQLFDTVPESRKHKIKGDSSRPDTISYINKKGFVVRPSKKGPKSIEDGVSFIKSFKKVIIHPRCKHTKYEFEHYSYKKDKLTGEILPIIVDADNHIIDPLRYALEDLSKGLKVPTPVINQRREKSRSKVMNLPS